MKSHSKVNIPAASILEYFCVGAGRKATNELYNKIILPYFGFE